MFQNNLKLAWRNLLKHRFFSLLNVVGLALGMASCLTAILIVRDQLSFDKFQPNSERVFRVNCRQTEGMGLATVPYPLGTTLQDDYNVAEATVRLVRSLYNTDALTQSGMNLPVSGYYTEPSFFEVFGFKLEAGNAVTALTEPNTIVLSKKTAERFFKDKNPVGETLELKDKGVYRITGVVAEPPGKSHLRFDVLASVATLNALEAAMKPDQAGEKILDNWPNRYMSYVYVLLQTGKGKADLDASLKLISEGRAKQGQEDKDVTFFSQNLQEISPIKEQLANNNTNGAPWFFIWGIIAFVVLLTVFPALNYANLAISRAMTRSREVGVRKAIGARAVDLRRLILTEAVLTAMLALVLAVLLSWPLNNFVDKYFPVAANLKGLRPEGLDWLLFAAFGILTGVLAGWLPARRLSRMQPVMALRSNGSGEVVQKRRFGWRTAMLVGQFTVSLVFLVFVATIWSQMKYMMVSDYGFQKENIVTVPLQGNKPDLLKNEFSKNPKVLSSTASSVLLASNNLQGMPVQLTQGGEIRDLHSALVDEDFVKTMNLQLVAGRDFPNGKTKGSQEFLILNEKAVETFQFGTPAEAIGKTLWLNDTTTAVVQGVVRDFHYRNLENAIEPFALHLGELDYGLLYLRLAPGDPVETMAALGSIWKSVDKVHPFDGEFMEENIRKAYGNVTFAGGLMSFFALLAIVLACMGLLGMVTYTMNSKVKEIGVRKVLGATVTQVAYQVSKRFLLLLGLAVVVALPIGYLLCNAFLNIFVYRIAVGGMILGGSAAVLIFLGLLTVGFQAGRAALTNPVKSLRSE